MLENEADPFVGREIAGFLIREKLGRGGMCSVYLATQTRLSRPVAFKILPQSAVAANPAQFQRFVREAKSAASLSHSNLVQIFDAGEQDDVHYIAMEYVPGLGLNELLRRYGALTEEQAIVVVIQAARGLAAAALKGIVHRDIKPGNIMITRDGMVKVTDFGLAKQVESDAQITAQGHVMGTPAYMSPEQCMGKPLDHRSDMYSLGITFFEMLAGRRPYVAESNSALIRMHCQAPVPPVTSVRVGVNSRLSSIIARMMAKDPSERHQDFTALAAELESVKSELTAETRIMRRPPRPSEIPSRPLDESTEDMLMASDSALLRLWEAVPEEVLKIEKLRRRIAGIGSEAPRGESGAGSPLLERRGVHASYGRVEALHGIDLFVSKGEIVTLIGANGAGKSTVLNAICGLVRASRGSILFDSKDITSAPTSCIAAMGISQVPEGRRLFPEMTVLENLEMGAYLRRDSGGIRADMEKAFRIFPILKERLGQQAGSLSGGEQQMCAMARGLMSRPRIMLLDEPSLGLSPILVGQIFEIIKELNRDGATILLVEQNARMALAVSSRTYVLETGLVAIHGRSAELAEIDEVKKAYLGCI